MDLDSSTELANRKSNILLVESELVGEIVNTSMTNDSHNTSSDSSFSGLVFLVSILCKGISFMTICEDRTSMV